MNSIIRTLFEGDYHYGLATLINSLYVNGFRGNIYAGYRGTLSPWATGLSAGQNVNHSILKVRDDILIHFVKTDTGYHFTNYKSHFVLTIWKEYAGNADNLFYFDPDIVIKCSWIFFEQWVSFGVALVHEIVWNDMPYNHPKRAMWQQVSNAMNIEVRNQLTSYINAGFVGLKKSDIEFLELWHSLINYTIKKSAIEESKFRQSPNNYALFTVADQDLLNLAAMCTKVKLSEMGPEAMDFIHGGWVMSHATGSPKPWKKSFLQQALYAHPPSLADKEYWKYANGIVNAQSRQKIKLKVLFIQIASFVGRFYNRY